MDIKNYIESGIIENFVLGGLSQEESSILECVMANNTAVKNAVLEAQETLEEVSFAYSVAPPPELKNAIFNQLNFQKPAADQKIIPLIPAVSEEKGLDATSKKSFANSWLAAASVVLLISLGYSIFQNREIKDQLVASKNQNAESSQQIQSLANQNNIILNADNIILKGVPNHPGMEATIFWDQSKMVYLSVKNLPKAPEGKQYQLWAIVDGKPVDAGMYKDGAEKKMQEMKMIENAQAFAITLEKTGGSAVPTMEEMYVMGEV